MKKSKFSINVDMMLLVSLIILFSIAVIAHKENQGYKYIIDIPDNYSIRINDYNKTKDGCITFISDQTNSPAIVCGTYQIFERN
jgi:hypothetical protein